MTQPQTAPSHPRADRPSSDAQAIDSPASASPVAPRRDVYQELIALVFYAYDFF